MGTGTPPQATPIFRAAGASVAVDVSVSKGTRPILGLGTIDFEVLDNGVRQTVEMISANDTPLDLSVIVVTTDWHSPIQRRSNQLETITDDVKRIIGFLGPKIGSES